MRKLSMKGKRGKSEASDSESENNGVASGVTRDLDESSNGFKCETSDSQSPTSRRSTNNATSRKRTTRSRSKQNDDSDKEEDATNVKEDMDEVGNEQENGNVSKPSGSKKRKKNEKKQEKVETMVEEDDEEYEVEKIIDQRTIKGRRQFLIRWKGYGADSDTWEQEKDLKCQQLIDDFMAEKEEDEKEEILEKSNSKSKGKQTKGKNNQKKSKRESKKDEKSEDSDANDKDSNKEYEVERIIDVHFKKNKSREFLIRWKGFSATDDTWEPEEHLNCPELISKFLEKLEKAKNSDPRELRANPMHTKRYVTQVHGKRHSRRHIDKQRVTYHHCDE